MSDSSPGADPISIVVADDHTVLRNGLRMLLEAEPDFEVVSEAGDIHSVLRDVRGYRPRRPRSGPQHARRLERRGDLPAGRPSRPEPRSSS